MNEKRCQHPLNRTQNILCPNIFVSDASPTSVSGMFCPLHRLCFFKEQSGDRCKRLRLVPSIIFCSLHISNPICKALNDRKMKFCKTNTMCNHPRFDPNPTLLSYSFRSNAFKDCAKARMEHENSCIHESVRDSGHNYSIQWNNQRSGDCARFADILSGRFNKQEKNKRRLIGGRRTKKSKRRKATSRRSRKATSRRSRKATKRSRKHTMQDAEILSTRLKKNVMMW